jgi:hypothetical protein
MVYNKIKFEIDKNNDELLEAIFMGTHEGHRKGGYS